MADAATIIDNIIAYYDNTDVDAHQNSVKRRARILNFLQHTAEDVWYSRAWPFSIGSDTLTCSSGTASLPSDFGRIGPEGTVLGPEGRAWTEIAYNDLVVCWSRNLEAHRRWYAIASGFYVIDQASTQTFSMTYQKLCPELTDDSSDLPFPAYFEHVLHHGAVAQLKAEEGDPRPHWRAEYVGALSLATSMAMPMRSRLRQMPNTIGGKW